MMTIAYIEMAAFLFAYVVGGITFVAGDAKVDPATLDHVRSLGAAAAGLLAALALASGLSSGSRGGPINLSRADVLLVLASPIKPAVLLRALVWRHLVLSTAAGVFVGAAVGVVASLRLPGESATWIGLAALFGALTGLLYSASASAACAVRIKTPLASVIASVVFLASGVDLLTGLRLSPATWLGALALIPLEPGGPGPVVALALVLVTAIVGVALIGNASIESVARRSELTGLVEFAAVREDFRVAWVESRRLAGEVPRRRPWFGMKIPRALAFRFPVWSRDARGMLRSPAARVGRLLLLALAAGFLLRMTVAGTTLALLAAGLCLYLAAIESSEGLAVDQDQLTIPSLLPLSADRLLGRHLATPALVLVVLWAVAMLPLVLGGNLHDGVVTALLMVGPVVGTALVAAGMTLTRRVTPLAESPPLVPGQPEAGGFVMVARAVARYGPPPVLVTAALVPALLAFGNSQSHPYWEAVIASCAVVALVDVIVGAWWLGLGPAARRRNGLADR